MLFNFVRSGVIVIYFGRLVNASIGSYGWSRSADSYSSSTSAYAQNLDFYVPSTLPSDYNDRYYATPLRCLAS